MASIRIDVTHMGLGLELRQLAFVDTVTLGQLKDKLYPKTGTEPNCMQLTLVDPSSGDRTELHGDDQTLQALGVENGSLLELVDSNDSSVPNTLLAVDSDAKPVKKYEAKSGSSGFAKFRKEAAAKAAAKSDGAADCTVVEAGSKGGSEKKSGCVEDEDEI
jgi:hypothetical protein